MDCVMCYAVQTCHELISCWLLGKMLSLNALSSPKWTVLYYADKNEWMASEIFKKWLMSWEVELQWKPRRVLMCIHKRAAHPHLDCFKNIHLKFLPPHTTSLVQLADIQILKNLKMLYHGKFIDYILETYENLLTSSSAAVQFFLIVKEKQKYH